MYEDGLVGRICLTSDMSEDDIFKEIRSVFRGPMEDNEYFKFNILQSTGGSSKTLVVPALSSSYEWTASAVAPKHVKTPIYIHTCKRTTKGVYNYTYLYILKINLYAESNLYLNIAFK